MLTVWMILFTQVEHMHLLTGTPLQNNMTELWALLSFLDAQRFSSLDAFLAEYGGATSADEIERLREAMRPYVLRRRKHEVHWNFACDTKHTSRGRCEAATPLTFENICRHIPTFLCS